MLLRDSLQSRWTFIERLYGQAEQHFLSSGKRDAANTLAEMMFDW